MRGRLCFNMVCRLSWFVFGQGSFLSGLLLVRVWTVISMYDKFCICAGSNIGVVVYLRG